MRNLLLEPIVWRGAERLMIVVVSLVCVLIGYRLFKSREVPNITTEMRLSSKLATLALTGRAPGLFLIVFSQVLLIVSLLTGGATSTEPLRETRESAKRVKGLDFNGETTARCPCDGTTR